MPTHPIQPGCEHPVDRLALSIEAVRGAQPASPMNGSYICFDAEVSALLCEGQWQNTCFEAAVSGGSTCFLCACACLEME